MKNRPTSRVLLSILSLLAAAAASAPAALLFDFGPTTITAADVLNSPGHATGAVSSSETTWNKVTDANITSGLLNADGSSALGISISLARETSIGSQVLDFTLASNFNATAVTGSQAAVLGSDYSNAVAPAAMDAVFLSGATTAQSAAIGLRIDGLTAGTYALYFVGRNTNAATALRPMEFYAAGADLSSTFDFSSLSSIGLTNGASSSNNTWILGNQYNTATVTLTAGQSIYLASLGASLNDLRGFINSVEVVAVPEPAGAFLWLGGIGMALALRTRRRLN